MPKRPSNHGGLDQHPQVRTNPARTQGESPRTNWRPLEVSSWENSENHGTKWWIFHCLNGGLLVIVFVGNRSDMPDKPTNWVNWV